MQSDARSTADRFNMAYLLADETVVLDTLVAEIRIRAAADPLDHEAVLRIAQALRGSRVVQRLVLRLREILIRLEGRLEADLRRCATPTGRHGHRDGLGGV